MSGSASKNTRQRRARDWRRAQRDLAKEVEYWRAQYPDARRLVEELLAIGPVREEDFVAILQAMIEDAVRHDGEEEREFLTDPDSDAASVAAFRCLVTGAPCRDDSVVPDFEVLEFLGLWHGEPGIGWTLRSGKGFAWGPAPWLCDVDSASDMRTTARMSPPGDSSAR